MTISDLLTILGIVLAIIAFISEKNRQFVLLKFSKRNWYFIISIFLLCNYLIGYNWFRDNFEFLSKFEINGFPTTGAYAYMISVITLIWATLKIYKGKFPEENNEKLMEYYIQLLFKSDYSTLTSLIEKYHFSDIIEFIKKDKSITIQNSTGLWQIDQQEYLKEYDKVINTSNLKIASRVLNRIIYDDAFIEEVSKKNPYIFTPIIQELDNNRVQNQDFINLYLKTLVKEKNKSFFREIKNNDNLSIHDSYALDNNRPILFSLFNNIEVAKINQAWRGIGEQAILELEEESKKDYSPLRESNREQDSDTLWSYRIQIAIWYFDIMVRQAIVSGANDHMWLFYYWHFIKSIDNNITQPELYDEYTKIPSRNHEMIEEIVSKQVDWIECIIKSEQDSILKSVCSCIGNCTFEIATSAKLSDDTKHYLIDWFWAKFISLWGDSKSKTPIINRAIDFAFESFRTPIMGIDHHSDKPEYVRIMKLVFDKKDMPKFTSHEERARIVRFENEVINQF